MASLRGETGTSRPDGKVWVQSRWLDRAAVPERHPRILQERLHRQLAATKPPIDAMEAK